VSAAQAALNPTPHPLRQSPNPPPACISQGKRAKCRLSCCPSGFDECIEDNALIHVRKRDIRAISVFQYGYLNLRLQRKQSDCTPKPQPSSRRNRQRAATLHDAQQGAATLVSLYWLQVVVGNVTDLPAMV